MNRALAIAIAVFLTLVSYPRPAAGQQAPRMSDGELWRGLEVPGRVTVLRSVIEGASITRETVLTLVQPGGAVAPLTRPGEERTLAAVIDQSTGLLAEVSPAQMERIVEVVTELYSDPANSCVTVASMASVAVRQLRGQLSASDLAQALAHLRVSGADGCSQ